VLPHVLRVRNIRRPTLPEPPARGGLEDERAREGRGRGARREAEGEEGGQGALD
jgi:hypothetical protein